MGKTKGTGMNAQDIINEFKDNVGRFSGGEIIAKGAITGILEKACGGKENRYLVLKVLTGKTSSKLLDEAEWYGLLCLVQPYKPAGGHWTTQRGENDLKAICGAILGFHAAQEGQLEMFVENGIVLGVGSGEKKAFGDPNFSPESPLQP